MISRRNQHFGQNTKGDNMNKIILIGNLTRDPEMKTIAQGTSVCEFTLAVSRKFKSADGTVGTDFINIVAWRQLADACSKYLSKGKKVCVVGSLQIRNYEAKDGSKRKAAEVVADDVEFLTPKGSDDSGVKQEPTVTVGDTEGFTEMSDAQLPF